MKNNPSFIERFISKTMNEKTTVDKNTIRPAITPDVLPETFHLSEKQNFTYQSNESFNTNLQNLSATDFEINAIHDKNTYTPRPNQHVEKNENTIAKIGVKTGKTKNSSHDDLIKNIKNDIRISSSKQNYTKTKKKDTLTRETTLPQIESQPVTTGDETVKKEKRASVSNEIKNFDDTKDVNLSEKSSQNYVPNSITSDFSESDTSNKKNILSPKTKIHESISQDRNPPKASPPLGIVFPTNIIEQNQDKTVQFPNSNVPLPTPDKQNQQRYEVPSEPIVTINIGRIEVHAAIPGRAQSVHTDNRIPPPSLSLKDYLKQRSGARQ